MSLTRVLETTKVLSQQPKNHRKKVKYHSASSQSSAEKRLTENNIFCNRSKSYQHIRKHIHITKLFR